MRVLITGAAGFIGHHLVDHLLVNTDWELVLLDRLDTSGSLARFQESEIFQNHKKRCTWVWGDLRSELNVFMREQIGQVDYILHLAAGSHVDRSITYPMEFVYDNVVGTGNLLDWARYQSLNLFVYFSTDEVFGPVLAGEEPATELNRYNSRNPYAASKSGAEQLCFAYENTYKMPLIVTRTMNNFGERQHPEKFIPMTIKKILKGEVVLIHGDETKTVSGSRSYIHARNTSGAILFLLRQWGEAKGSIVSGESFNIVGEKEVSNLEMAQKIAVMLGRELKYEMVDFHTSRPGHDLRYAMDGTKMRSLGWNVPMTFEDSLIKTVTWTIAHPEWLL